MNKFWRSFFKFLLVGACTHQGCIEEPPRSRVVTGSVNNVTFTCVTMASPEINQFWLINGSHLRDVDPDSSFTSPSSESNSAGRTVYSLTIHMTGRNYCLTSVTCLANQCGNETAYLSVCPQGTFIPCLLSKYAYACSVRVCCSIYCLSLYSNCRV